MYELIYIVSSKIEEKERLAMADKVEASLKEFNAKIIEKKDDGEKKLAYVINHENFGYYTTIYFEVEPEQIKRIEDKLKTNNEILRLQIFKSRDLFAKEDKKKTKKKKTEEDEKKEAIEEKVKMDFYKDDILEI